MSSAAWAWVNAGSLACSTPRVCTLTYEAAAAKYWVPMDQRRTKKISESLPVVKRVYLGIATDWGPMRPNVESRQTLAPDDVG